MHNTAIHTYTHIHKHSHTHLMLEIKCESKRFAAFERRTTSGREHSEKSVNIVLNKIKNKLNNLIKHFLHISESEIYIFMWLQLKCCSTCQWKCNFGWPLYTFEGNHAYALCDNMAGYLH